MLDKQQFTEQDKKAREDLLKMKEQKDSESKAQIEEAKQEFDKKKKQDFDDLMSGKMKKDSEKSLQDIFKEYYSTAKTINTKEYINSAKSSINSFSSTLEKKR